MDKTDHQNKMASPAGSPGADRMTLHEAAVEMGRQIDQLGGLISTAAGAPGPEILVKLRDLHRDLEAAQERLELEAEGVL